MPKLKATKWESKDTKLVPWETEVILTAEETQILLELQELAKEKTLAGTRYQTIIVPRTIFEKLASIYVSRRKSLESAR